MIFGSQAKGTAKHNSDIDLAIAGIDDELRVETIAMELDAFKVFVLDVGLLSPL